MAGNNGATNSIMLTISLVDLFKVLRLSMDDDAQVIRAIGDLGLQNNASAEALAQLTQKVDRMSGTIDALDAGLTTITASLATEDADIATLGTFVTSLSDELKAALAKPAGSPAQIAQLSALNDVITAHDTKLKAMATAPATTVTGGTGGTPTVAGGGGTPTVAGGAGTPTVAGAAGTIDPTTGLVV